MNVLQRCGIGAARSVFAADDSAPSIFVHVRVDGLMGVLNIVLTVLRGFFKESIGDDVRSLSDRVFGAPVDLDQFYYDSFMIGTKDIACSVETMFEDAKQLAMIRSKLATGLKGTKISEIFAIRSDVWTGYFYCYGDQQYKVLDFFAFSKDHSVIGGVKFRGECKN